MADAPEPLPDPADVWPPPPAVKSPVTAACPGRFLFWSVWLDMPLGFVFGLFSYPLLVYGLLLPLALTKANSGLWERPWAIAVSSVVAGVLHLLLFRSTRRRSLVFASSTLVGASLIALLLLGALFVSFLS